MYKIQNKLVPNYLSAICPNQRREDVQYNLRNQADIGGTNINNALYFKNIFSSHYPRMEQTKIHSLTLWPPIFSRYFLKFWVF